MVYEIKKKCYTHGRTRHLLQGAKNPRYKCTKCSVEAVFRRRRKLKKMGVAFLGGKCQKCGYNTNIRALVFFHIEKKKVIGKGTTKAWEKLKEDLTDCDLLCLNCHAEVYVNEYN